MSTAPVAEMMPQRRAEPVPAATFMNVVRSEWTKLVHSRATFWTLAVAFLLVFGLCVLFTNYSYSAYHRGDGTWDPLGLSEGGFVLGQLALIIFGTMTVTNEYATGLIRPTLLAVPNRSRLLAAKVLVLAVVAFVAGEIFSLGSFFMGQAIISAHHVPTISITAPGAARAVLGIGLLVVLTALSGAGIGLLIRHTGGSIAVGVGFVFVLPLVLNINTKVINLIHEYWPPSAGRSLAQVNPSGSYTLGPWAGAGVFLAFVVVLLVVSGLVLNRRDA